MIIHKITAFVITSSCRNVWTLWLMNQTIKIQYKEASQSVFKNQPCDVIKIGDCPSFKNGFLPHFSSHTLFLWRHMADFLKQFVKLQYNFPKFLSQWIRNEKLWGLINRLMSYLSLTKNIEFQSVFLAFHVKNLVFIWLIKHFWRKLRTRSVLW